MTTGRWRWGIAAWVGIACLAGAAGAAEPPGTAEHVPDRFGAAALVGNTYDPRGDITFVQASGFALYDYDRVWPHRAPDALRFKVEGALGATTRPATRVVASAGMLALYYLDRFRTPAVRPYVEAGVGLIYTDFRVHGQGLRLNFNPQAGFGAEWRTAAGATYFAGFRLHHVSNGNLYRDNRGINSALVLAGRFF